MGNNKRPIFVLYKNKQNENTKYKQQNTRYICFNHYSTNGNYNCRRCYSNILSTMKKLLTFFGLALIWFVILFISFTIHS